MNKNSLPQSGQTRMFAAAGVLCLAVLAIAQINARSVGGQLANDHDQTDAEHADANTRDRDTTTKTNDEMEQPTGLPAEMQTQLRVCYSQTARARLAEAYMNAHSDAERLEVYHQTMQNCPEDANAAKYEAEPAKITQTDAEAPERMARLNRKIEMHASLNLTAQATSEAPRYTCYSIASGRKQLGCFTVPECWANGVVPATAKRCTTGSSSSTSSVPVNDNFFCYKADGSVTKNRAECVNVAPPQRTPEEERLIIKQIEAQRVEEKREQRQAELLNALNNANDTVLKYLNGDILVFSKAEETTLANHNAWLNSQIKTGKQAKFSMSEMDSIAIELRKRIASTREIIQAARDALAEVVPPIENIMLRIDDLVRRVGTLIGNLEKDGQSVPLTVKRGYEKAKVSMTDAQRNCSPRRPQNCLVLLDVLNAIEAMRGPLCALPSERLTFCNQ